MGFQTGLSGLNAFAKSLDVIGNNIANSSTPGFKTSQAQFADVFAASLSGGSGSQVGIGTKVATIAQQFTQGNVSVSNNPMDVAINGRGFFRFSGSGAITYSRNGQLQLDKNSYIVNNNGLRLTGYMADATGAITGSLGDIQVSTTGLVPKATTKITVGVNLNSNDSVPANPWVAPNPTGVPLAITADPKSYNASTSTTVYDSLGNQHIATMYFRKTAANTWNVYTTVDGYSVAGAASTAVVTPSPATTLTFTSSGKIAGGALPAINIDLATINPSLGAASPLSINMDFGNTTQFGAVFGVNSLSQDGYASGQLNGFGIGADGIVQGRYSNGQTLTLGQVVLANFANPQGLQPLGNNQWSETPNSGGALVGAPGSASLGVLQSAAVEESNVDMTQELVNMIVAQRAYQANAQTIKTQDQVLQTLVNMR